MSSSVTDRKFGQITFLETLGLFGVVFALPVVQAWRLLWKPFVPHDRVRTWRRVKGDAAAGFATAKLNPHQIQFVDGTTEKVYEKWAPGAGVKVDKESIDEGSQLLWVTPRKRKRVIVYFHGGGFVLSTPPFAISFWKKVVDILQEKGEDFSLALLEYTLIPTAQFPTPLKQSVACIKHLISSGYAPEDISLVGDSAGGNLILQIFAHILHPVPGVPDLPALKIGRAIVISPWVTLNGTSESFATNDSTDIFRRSFYDGLGSLVLPKPDDPLRVYVEPSRAPADWYAGVDKLVAKILVTVGDAECLKDDIYTFSDAFSKVHPGANVIKIPGGTHNEPYGAFAAGEPHPGEWPTNIANWLASA